ncbi:MAG: nucleotide exchange factor GrpE [Candidatus Micrarchaeota archaeon]
MAENEGNERAGDEKEQRGKEKVEGEMDGEGKVLENLPETENNADYHKEYLEAKKACEEYLTRLKYMQADLENFRKRAAKEKMEIILQANEALLSDLLPTLDAMGDALQKMEEGEHRKGMQLIRSNLLLALKENGLQEIPLMEKEGFDHDCAEAVSKEKTDDLKLAGKVAKIIQKGYLLNGKVLRFAKVAVYAEGKEK